MSNNSGLHPLGRAVLVVHEEPKKKGLIEIPDQIKERSLMLEQKARVLEIGPACWPDEPARATAGDLVLISKAAGYLAKGKDDQMYRVVNDRDIFCSVDEETE